MQLRSLDTSYNECVLIASEEREDVESRYLTKRWKRKKSVTISLLS